MGKYKDQVQKYTICAKPYKIKDYCYAVLKC